MNKDHFFGRPYLYPSIWAIIIAIFSFIGGIIWKNISGPDEVIVLKNRSSKDTTITIVQFTPDLNYLEKLNDLTKKSIQKHYSNSSQESQKSTIDSLTLAISKAYQLKFESLNFKNLEKINPPLEIKIPIQIKDPSADISKVNRPLYILPENVKGYVQESSNAFLKSSINAVEFKRNDNIILTLEFFDNSILQNITPFFVDLVSKNQIINFI